MGSFALLLATPLFGLSLQLQTVAADTTFSTHLALRVTTPLVTDTQAEGDGASETDVDASDSEDSYVEQMRTRESLAGVHRVLGISTWIAMTATVVGGFLQYYNLYGFFADQASNPCVEGTAVFGQGQCSGTPWPHLIGAATTTLLYAGTFSLALLMPDPDNLADGPGEFASTLRMHKLLRWIHFGGMLMQAGLGVVVANGATFGIDRANNYGTLQTLTTVHLATGVLTLGALTWAGALMTF